MSLSRHVTVVQAKQASIGAMGIAVVASSLIFSYMVLRRYKRSKWHEEEEETYGHETLHTIIAHFASLRLDASATVEEANQRRTGTYYLKAREAHEQSLVLGVANYERLQYLRQKELNSMMKYYNLGDKSHRTVVIMLDPTTGALLDEARRRILEPLQFSHNIKTKGVWIPHKCLIPPEDMHVTVAIPWFWHTICPGNDELSHALCARFRQALVLDFHFAFQLELERIILLGGKTLVALWRTVGERRTDDGTVIYDRYGTTLDPMVRLRREIVDCFTAENSQFGFQPLTYAHRKNSGGLNGNSNSNSNNGNQGSKPSPAAPVALRASQRQASTATSEPSQKPPSRPPPEEEKKQEDTANKNATATAAESQDGGGRPPLKRQNSIELRTPGMGQGDGFIHTTLCRLPLNCLSEKDVELDKVHRLCREATATLCGLRMVVKRFRFLETTRKGGESNPCIEPIFDETVEAPYRVIEVQPSGAITVQEHYAEIPQDQRQDKRNTIGALPEFPTRGTMEGLFDDPES